MGHIDNIDEIIEFLGIEEKEEKRNIKKRYAEGDILIVKMHKNFIYYYWE